MLTMEDIQAIVKPHNDKLIAEGRAANLERENAKLLESLKWALPLAELTLEMTRQERLQYGHNDIGAGTNHLGLWDFEVENRDKARALLNAH